MDKETLIRALRCASAPVTAGHSCEGCPYRVLERIDGIDIPIPPDKIIAGVKYWEGCDCDQIALDAADYIEQMEESNGI